MFQEGVLGLLKHIFEVRSGPVAGFNQVFSGENRFGGWGKKGFFQPVPADFIMEVQFVMAADAVQPVEFQKKGE